MALAAASQPLLAAPTARRPGALLASCACAVAAAHALAERLLLLRGLEPVPLHSLFSFLTVHTLWVSAAFHTLSAAASVQAAAGLGTSLTRFLDVAAPLVYAMCAFMCAVFYILVWPDYEAFSADPLGRRLYQATHEIHAGPALLAAAHRALRLAGCGNGGGRTLSPSTYAALSLVFSSFYTALLYSDAAHTGEFAYAFMRKMGTLGRAGACAGCAAAKASLAAACAAALGRDAARTGASTGRDEEDKVKAAARARPLATAAAAAAGTSSNKLE